MRDMPAGSRHYNVTLHYKQRQMTVPFSMGPALTHDPTSIEVMECLLSDWTGIEVPFEEWASDLGYEPDSRKAERTFEVIVRQSQKLTTFLGDDFMSFMNAER
jgi:DNA-binding helix-hairpin-helix protein with protein kinase domain